MRPGTRVEALMSGTQGTWYVARIVEFASFPPHYIDNDVSESSHWLSMVCVHYEGVIDPNVADINRIFTPSICMDSTIITSTHVLAR